MVFSTTSMKVCLILAVLTQLSCIQAKGGTPPNKNNVDDDVTVGKNETGSGCKFSYDDQERWEIFDSTKKNGCTKWICGGKEQSPISLPPVEELGERANPLKIEYKSADLKINETSDEGFHGIHWGPKDKKADLGTFTDEDGKKYKLNGFHMHVKSEHSINGGFTDMEIHFVNESSDKKIAVISIMSSVPSDPKKLAAVEKSSPLAIFSSKKDEKNEAATEFNIQSFFTDPSVDLKKYYQYEGSFTTPPCTEGVKWYVLHVDWFIPRSYFKELVKKDDNHMDARYNQPLNSRIVNTGPKMCSRFSSCADHAGDVLKSNAATLSCKKGGCDHDTCCEHAKKVDGSKMAMYIFIGVFLCLTLCGIAAFVYMQNAPESASENVNAPAPAFDFAAANAE